MAHDDDNKPLAQQQPQVVQPQQFLIPAHQIPAAAQQAGPAPQQVQGDVAKMIAALKEHESNPFVGAKRILDIVLGHEDKENDQKNNNRIDRSQNTASELVEKWIKAIKTEQIKNPALVVQNIEPAIANLRAAAAELDKPRNDLIAENERLLVNLTLAKKGLENEKAWLDQQILKQQAIRDNPSSTQDEKNAAIRQVGGGSLDKYIEGILIAQQKKVGKQLALIGKPAEKDAQGKMQDPTEQFKQLSDAYKQLNDPKNHNPHKNHEALKNVKDTHKEIEKNVRGSSELIAKPVLLPAMEPVPVDKLEKLADAAEKSKAPGADTLRAMHKAAVELNKAIDEVKKVCANLTQQGLSPKEIIKTNDYQSAIQEADRKISALQNLTKDPSSHAAVQHAFKDDKKALDELFFNVRNWSEALLNAMEQLRIKPAERYEPGKLKQDGFFTNQNYIDPKNYDKPVENIELTIYVPGKDGERGERKTLTWPEVKKEFPGIENLKMGDLQDAVAEWNKDPKNKDNQITVTVGSKSTHLQCASGKDEDMHRFINSAIDINKKRAGDKVEQKDVNEGKIKPPGLGVVENKPVPQGPDQKDKQQVNIAKAHGRGGQGAGPRVGQPERPAPAAADAAPPTGLPGLGK